jgi:hypothetical protein
VALLGTIALSGMIMRNSVILVDQIEQDIAAGQSMQWEAIVESTVRRFRPIVLTAAAAILAMVPLVAQHLLRADGGGDHGRADRRHRAHHALPAGAVRGLVLSRARCVSSCTRGKPAGDGLAEAPTGLALGGGGGDMEDSGPLTTALQFLSTRVLEINVPPLASIHL